MAAKVSRKQLILECSQRLGFPMAGERELRLVQNELRQTMVAKAPSLSYIARVLRQAGARVAYEDRYTDPVIPERYAANLEGALKFDDLATAEAALRRLDAAHREYERGTDHAGKDLVRKLVLRGKQRAESLAANARVNAQKRQEKREIAAWFRVWLESPGFFFDWLELRKQAEDFQQLYSLPDKPYA